MFHLCLWHRLPGVWQMFHFHLWQTSVNFPHGIFCTLITCLLTDLQNKQSYTAATPLQCPTRHLQFGDHAGLSIIWCWHVLDKSFSQHLAVEFLEYVLVFNVLEHNHLRPKQIKTLHMINFTYQLTLLCHCTVHICTFALFNQSTFYCTCMQSVILFYQFCPPVHPSANIVSIWMHIWSHFHDHLVGDHSNFSAPAPLQ